MWPSPDYTRLTIESQAELRYQISVVKDPDRLVLDLEAVDFDQVQRETNGKILVEDPHVKGLRVGRFKPDVVRIVLDLKTEANPQVFTLKPVADYGHRLVVDVYPVNPPDPLLALLQKQEQKLVLPEPTDPAKDATRSGSGTPGDAPAAGAAALAPGGRAIGGSRPKALPARTLTIVVDAGHGGEDPGARGHRGSHEKHVTLAIARRVKSLIDAEPNMRAVMTRDGDYFIPLHVRVDKARRVRADLFVSIHADAFTHSRARGSSVFALSESGATSVAAAWLARRENDADLIGGVNLPGKDRHLARTLLDLSQTATINDSLKLGRSVLREIGGINQLHKPHVEQAGFAVLKAPDIPSILVETAFITNPEEERRLTDTAYQDRMARAIVAGIKRYFATNPPINRSTIAATEDEAEREPSERLAPTAPRVGRTATPSTRG